MVAMKKRAETPDDPGHVQDGPGATKETWFACALLSATLTFLLFCVVAYQVLLQFSLSSENAVFAARSGGALLAFGAAATTFFLVLYRSEITKLQVVEAKRQNDSKDEVELGLLLEKAVALLRQEDRDDLSLALSMLETVALAPIDKYSLFALEFAADQILRVHLMDPDDAARCILQLQRIFTFAAKRERKTRDRDFNFPANDTTIPEDVQKTPFDPIPEYPIRSIKNAVIYLHRRNQDCLAKAALKQCRLIQFGSRDPKGFRVGLFSAGNVITSVKIAEIDSSAFREEPNSFVDCDLSNADLSDLDTLNSEKFKGCFYVKGQPPCVDGEPIKDAPSFFTRHGIDIAEKNKKDEIPF